MRAACIDIGSNTTRLLVADVEGAAVHKVQQERVFTHLRRHTRGNAPIAPERIAEQASIAAEQVAVARLLGAERIVIVATAAVRRMPNADELAAALLAGCGVPLTVLSERDEARLAFCGACAALRCTSVPEPVVEDVRAHGAVDGGELGVIDVGGGSSELVVGTAPDRVRWSFSCELGSGDLSDQWLPSDPPSAPEVSAARDYVAQSLCDVPGPTPGRAVAVGGSAASLLPLAGTSLDARAFSAALDVLLSAPAADVARRFGLDAQRVRLLPAGVLILQAAQERFGVPLRIVAGGLREGMLLDVAGGAGRGAVDRGAVHPEHAVGGVDRGVVDRAAVGGAGPGVVDQGAVDPGDAAGG